MAGRPLKLPGHRPVPRERPASRGRHPLARCLSRAREASAAPGKAILDAAAHREAALRRLQRLAERAEAEATEVQSELVDALLHCRGVSLELVEAFDRWRISGSRGGMTLEPQYVVNMKEDTRWLAESALAELLPFSTKSDPFFVVPSSREASSPSNPMTATLQAKKAKGKLGLPLPSSMLRRIRKAELVIMRESMQARLSRREAPRRPLSPFRPVAQLAHAQAPPQILEEAPAERLRRVKGDAKVLDLGAYAAHAVNVSDSEMKALFQRYLERVPEDLVRSTDYWEQLEISLQGDGDVKPARGALALEWFWLRSKGEAAPGPTTADGLCAFQLQRSGGKNVGQLRHFSVVSMDHYEEALVSVKNLMFARLPVMSLRMVIWCREESEDGKLMANASVEASLKTLCFRWFRFENKRGSRGKEMNRPRGEPPMDPEMPLEVPSIEVCLGQVWLRGASSAAKPVEYAGNLALAAACLRSLKGKDDADAVPPESLLDKAAAAAWCSWKQGLAAAAMTGRLEDLLGRLAPVPLEARAEEVGRDGAALLRRLLQRMEEGHTELPEALVQAVAEASELVRRGLSQAALQEAVKGLRTEQLPQMVSEREPRDGAFGRLLLTLEWQHVRVLEEDSFQVPVVATARCPGHAQPVYYLPTSEEAIFVVVIPWQGSEEDVFARCTNLLRDAEPMEPVPPISCVQLSTVERRQSVRACNVDAEQFELGAGLLHVMDFSSLWVCSGRGMPGKLGAAMPPGDVCVLEKPYALCLWHSDMDELNAPLSVSMVA